jgi:hypothetical protein
MAHLVCEVGCHAYTLAMSTATESTHGSIRSNHSVRSGPDPHEAAFRRSGHNLFRNSYDYDQLSPSLSTGPVRVSNSATWRGALYHKSRQDDSDDLDGALPKTPFCSACCL